METMGEMMDAMMADISKEDRLEMMGKMMDSFFAGMTAEDKQNMMERMMPKMMEGINMMEMMPKMMGSMMGGMMGSGESGSGMMGMMSQMMGGGQGAGMSMMPHRMTVMMPQCLNMMLPNVPKKERIEFVLKMVSTLVEQGSVDMSDDEKRDFMTKVAEKAKV